MRGALRCGFGTSMHERAESLLLHGQHVYCRCTACHQQLPPHASSRGHGSAGQLESLPSTPMRVSVLLGTQLQSWQTPLLQGEPCTLQLL